MPLMRTLEEWTCDLCGEPFTAEKGTLKPVTIENTDHWCCSNCRKAFTDLRDAKKVKSK